MLSLKKQLPFYKAGFPKNYRHLLIRKLAALWLRLNPQVKVIGIVGSYGKTTTAQTVYQALNLSGPTLATDINLDTIYNLPLTILKLRRYHRYLVLEIGVDHQGEMDFHLDLVKPDLLIFTGITPVHAQKGLLNSLDGIKKEKGKAVEAVKQKEGWVVANADNLGTKRLIKEKKVKKIIWYGIKSKKADFQAKEISLNKKGTAFTIRSKEGEIKVRGQFWGEGYVAAFLGAAGIVHVLKQPLENLVKAGKSLKALPGRMSLEKGPGGSLLVNDRLRASPASAKLGLETLAKLPISKRGRKIVVLGEMGELGRYAKGEHQKVGKLLEILRFDQVIGIGPLLKETGKKTKITWAKDIIKAAKVVEKLKLNPKDILYLKGSLLKHMERLLLYLEGKKVGCQVISCDFYKPCDQCEYLKTGLS